MELFLQAEKKNLNLTVEAIGTGVEKADYKAGDKVLFREYAGTNIKLDDEEFVVIKDEDIIAVSK